MDVQRRGIGMGTSTQHPYQTANWVGLGILQNTVGTPGKTTTQTTSRTRKTTLRPPQPTLMGRKWA